MSAFAIMSIFLNILGLLLMVAGLTVMWSIFGKSIKAYMKKSNKKKGKNEAVEAAEEVIPAKTLKGLGKPSKLPKKNAAPVAPVVDEDISLSGKGDKQEGLSLGDWNGVK